jgi:hypothetical protein
MFVLILCMHCKPLSSSNGAFQWTNTLSADLHGPRHRFVQPSNQNLNDPDAQNSLFQTAKLTHTFITYFDWPNSDYSMSTTSPCSTLNVKLHSNDCRSHRHTSILKNCSKYTPGVFIHGDTSSPCGHYDGRTSCY